MSRPLPLWRSLRLRLPLLMSGLIALVLVTVFWVINREIEKGLLRAGSEPPQVADDEGRFAPGPGRLGGPAPDSLRVELAAGKFGINDQTGDRR